jgi:DNA-binding protein HU-beta
MTKADLIRLVNEKVDSEELTKKLTEQVIEATFDVIKESLQKEERFIYPRFGTFTAKERAARKGRNPQNNEEIIIPAYKTVTFKPAPQFKDALK